MENEYIKVQNRTDFSEGYACLVDTAGKVYIVSENGNVTQTKYFNCTSKPSSSNLVPFKNGVCAVDVEHDVTNPNDPSLHHSSVVWLTRAGYALGELSYFDLSVNPDTLEVVGSSHYDKPYLPKMVELAQQVYTNPQSFFDIKTKSIKKERFSAEQIKALCDVARHAFEQKLEKGKKGQKNGDKTYIDYELCLKDVTKYVEKVKNHLATLLEKGSKYFGGKEQ